MSRLLRDAGHEVLLASNGAEALSAFGAGHIDLIVSDISMPIMDGVTLLRRVRELNEDIPFILLAGAPSANTAIDALRFHATEYLPKPVERSQLLESVTHALGLNRLAQIRREALSLYQERNSQFGEASRREMHFGRAVAAIYMVYQPIISWSRQCAFGYEALVRSSETSLSGPGALFDAAEQLGRLHDVGRQIRSKCVEPFGPEQDSLSLFVNLHTEDLLDDDIGAGYSGLNSFAIIQPDIVKLDITMIRGIDTDPVKRKLVRALKDLCQDLGIVVVAEGVETPSERDTLVQLGCDLLQGYLFARPGAPFPKPVFRAPSSGL
jgi:EAL domain-containing protein (putative c-di-GMP-specific phosphodiesterase class I)/CheY-like chemotaxis protein